MGDVNKQDIYAEVILRGIRNGAEWNKAVLCAPNQSKVSYTKMEQDLADLAKSWGDTSLVVEDALVPTKPGR